MVIGVDGDVPPKGHVGGDAIVRQQVPAFLVLEHHHRPLAGGAMHPLTGGLEAPRSGLAACVGQVDEGAALPEAAACVVNKSFDLGRIPRPAHTSWVQEQPARLAVLHKRARWAGVEWIGTHHRGREIIQDQPLGAALEGSPRLLQALDRGFPGCWTSRHTKLWQRYVRTILSPTPVDAARSQD